MPLNKNKKMREGREIRTENAFIKMLDKSRSGFKRIAARYAVSGSARVDSFIFPSWILKGRRHPAPRRTPIIYDRINFYYRR